MQQHLSLDSSIDGNYKGSKNLKLSRKSPIIEQSLIKFDPFNSSNEPEERLQRNKNNCSSTNATGSTLSLHIAAYEDSIEADTVSLDLSKTLHKKKASPCLLKRLRNAFTCSPLDLQNPFEFPRQQENELNEPEIMQFTASQKLFSPSQSFQNVDSVSHAMFVVVGGGVAGVCCVQELVQLIDNYPTSSSSAATVSPGTQITFICGSAGFIKTVDEVSKVTKILETVKVKESPVTSYFPSNKVKVIQENVKSWDSKKKILLLTNGEQIKFDKLCIATGARPINSFVNDHVLTLRDMDTVENLKKRLETSRRVVLVGNGGIANELAYELKGVEIIWAIRHSSIAASYFDKQAATLFLPRLATGRSEETPKPEAVRTHYTISNHKESTSEADPSTSGGCALGPYWLSKLDQKDGNTKRKVHIIKDVEVANIENWSSKHSTSADLPNEFESDKNDWKASVLLSDGQSIGCDLVIFGIGVTPNSEIWKDRHEELKVSADNGIEVNDKMETSIKDVFCAGDICTAKGFQSNHWSQMRLWTQARSMGIYCARSMFFGDVEPDICFEIFTHNTSFYGFNVVFLGDFAGEHLETPYDADVRCSPEREYIKVLTKDNRVHGVVLVGETDLAETFENLILDQTDVSAIIDDLLNPHFDIEDYYD